MCKVILFWCLLIFKFASTICNTIFLPVFILGTFVKIQVALVVYGNMWVLNSCLLTSICVFCAYAVIFLLKSVVQFGIRPNKISPQNSFCSEFFGYSLGFLWFHVNFKIFFLHEMNSHRIFIMITLNVKIVFCRMPALSQIKKFCHELLWVVMSIMAVKSKLGSISVALLKDIEFELQLKALYLLIWIILSLCLLLAHTFIKLNSICLVLL